MKKLYPLIAGCAALLALHTGCSKDPLAPGNDTPTGETNRITLTATQKGLVQTRLVHEYDAITKAMAVTWSAGDAFRLYGLNNGTSEKFTLDEGIGSTYGTFTGNLPSGANSFNAFYPSSVTEGKTWEQCEFDITGQVQDGGSDASTAHLSDYNFMTLYNPAGVTEATILTHSLMFEHEVAIFRIEVELPSEYIPTHLQLRTTLDVSGSTKYGFVTARAAHNGEVQELNATVTLELENVPKTNTFVAYMAMLPSTLKDDITYNIYCDGPAPAVCTLVVPITGSWSYIAGRVYHAEIRPDINNTASLGLFSSGITGDSGWSGSGNSDSDPYLIGSAKQLKHLIDQVAGGNDYSGKYFRLGTDIHVTADTWTPIGSDPTPFAGTFDGGGSTISGLLQGSSPLFGFFGSVSGGEISNLNIAANIIYDANTPVCFVGGIAGQASGTIMGCINSGPIIAISSTGSTISAGGILGTSLSLSNINNNLNTGSIYLSGSVSGSQAGGIVGLNSGILHLNTNSGEVASGVAGTSTGGLAGSNSGQIFICNDDPGPQGTWIGAGSPLTSCPDH